MNEVLFIPARDYRFFWFLPKFLNSVVAVGEKYVLIALLMSGL